MRPSRRRTLGIGRVTSPPDCAGRDADKTFEGSAERGLGLVAESARDIAKRRVVFLEPRQRNVHSPPRHVAHRRLADELRKARRERRTRHGNLGGRQTYRAKNTLVQPTWTNEHKRATPGHRQ